MFEETAPSEDWVFSIYFDNHEYRVIWAGYPVANTDDYVEHYLIVEKDGEQGNTSEDVNVASVREAAAAFRISQLRYEFPVDAIAAVLSQANETYKDYIVSLAERSFNQEYLGQDSNSNLYLQTVARILNLDYVTVFRLTSELIKEQRVGLTGAILIPYSIYREEKKYWEEENGHKDFSASDMGGWACHYCGAHGWAESEQDAPPSSFECLKDKYLQS